jgi:hypothetical protein
MRSRLPITGVISVAALSLCAAAAVALYDAGSAAALTRPVPQGSSTAWQGSGTARQVSGTVLESALLPAGDFGSGYTAVASGAPNSGSRLLPPGPGLNPAIVSCSTFESVVYLEAYGQTAGAMASFVNPAWQAGGVQISEGQEIAFQFGTARAAATFYQRAYAKYMACESLTVPQPSDTAIGGGALDLSTMTITKTTVAGYPAFQQVQFAARSETSGLTFFRNTLTVVAGTDVYQIFDYSGTNDEPFPALMADLIQRVQHLR